MGIIYAPPSGTLLICTYKGNKRPEMDKPRPVILLSSVSPGLGIVVPLSVTPPQPVRPWHYFLTLAQPVSDYFTALQCWVKCDMISVVAFERLNLPCEGRVNGKRKYKVQQVSSADLAAIRTAVWQAIS